MAYMVAPARFMTRDIVETDSETGVPIRDWPKLRSKGIVLL